MLQPILRQAPHIRVRPLSVNDRRQHLTPLPQRSIVRHVTRKPLVRQSRQIAPAQQRVQRKVDVVKGGVITNPTKYLDMVKVKGVGIGKILVIIGNGPTHRLAPLERLKDNPNIHTMSINKPDPRLWPSTYWMFVDSTQFRRHADLWHQYNGIVFNTLAIKETRANCYKTKSLGNMGFSEDVSRGVFIGHTTVYAAMQIGLYMEYDHIYIFGVDMCAVGGKLYPWGQNPDVKDEHRAKRFPNEAKSFEWAANNLGEKRHRFTFCSELNPFPFVDKYNPRLAHMEAVDKILERAKIL